MRTIKFPLRMMVVVLLIGLFLYMISVIFRYGLADIKHYQATSMMSQRESGDDRNTLNLWRMTRSILQQVNELHPDNPHYLELLAKANEQQGGQSRGPVAEILYRDALNSLEEAIKRRPVSPYTWANIAKIKARLGEFDEQFSVAVESAVKFGPWIVSIQQAVAVISFRYWEKVPEGLKSLLRENLSRAAKIQQQSLFVLAEKHAATQLLCSSVESKPEPKSEQCVLNKSE